MPFLNYERGVVDGREQAANLLIKTAEDYEQMAKMESGFLRAPKEFDKRVHTLRHNDYINKANLLRGQAGLIRNIS